MKNAIFIISILLFNMTFSQNVKIKGTFDTAPEFVVFNKSFDENLSEYKSIVDTVWVKNNSFGYSYNKPKTGLVLVYGKDFCFWGNLICNNGDEIILKIKDQDKKKIVEFEGANAEGNKLLNTLPDFRKMYIPVNELFSKTLNPEEFLKGIHQLELKIKEPLDTLLSQKKITQSFYNFSISYAETERLALCSLNLEGLLKTENNTSSNYQVNGKDNQSIVENIRTIIRDLDSKYDAFDDKYRDIRTGNQYHNIINKCSYIDHKIISGNYNDYGLWSKENSKYNYAPKNLQEFVCFTEITKNDFDIPLFLKYKKVFPKGVYLEILMKQYEMVLKDKQKALKPFVVYTLNEDKMLLKNNSDKTINSLEELIQNSFQGKSVFVDLWATYCGPCKEEFKYSEELHQFLKSQNIEILYLSLDKENSAKRWQDDILKYKLYGNHFLGMDKFRDLLITFLNDKQLLIPRYLLFNASGKLVKSDNRRPSDKQILYDEIIQVLN